MINKNTCSKRERRGDLFCPRPVWLICCGLQSIPSWIKHVKVHVFLDKHWESFSCTQMNPKNEIQFFFSSHWISNCQESYLSDTFIFVFVLSPTVCLFWHSSAPLLPCPSDPFEGNEKAVILRCRLKVSSCRGSLAHHFLRASLRCTVHTRGKVQWKFIKCS